MKKTALAGRCGIYCGACDFHIAIKHPEIKQDLSNTISVDAKDIHCTGCGELDEHSWGIGCKTAICCDNHKVEFCFECKEFPCEELHKMVKDPYPHHHSAIKELLRMKEVGVDKWLEEQEKRWSCEECGEPFSWYWKNCLKCGNGVKSCGD